MSVETDFLVKNIKIVDPAQNRKETDGPFDMLVENGFIKAIEMSGTIPESSARQVIDGQGHLCVPGLIDVHTHLREPGFEYKETVASGTLSAAAGGFTSVLCMANTNPVNDNPYVTQYIQSQAEKYAHVRVYIVGALSKGLMGEELAEIGKMKEAGIVAVSDDGMPVMNSYLMRKALDYCRAFDLPIVSHAEDANLVGQGVMHEGYHSNCLGLRGIPAESEEIIVARDIALARLTKGRVHFAHLSTRQALEHVKRAKDAGILVTCEVTPHHLSFTDEDVKSYDSNFKMAPPLRTEQDIQALKQALADGTIDCIATDHAPHAPRDKEVLFEFAANGVVGLETAWSVGLELVKDGIFNLTKLVELMSLNPAKLAKLPGGTLAIGAAADFMISDQSSTHVLESENLCSKSRNSPWIGRTQNGKVLGTFVGGVCKWGKWQSNR